jgi:hypothetical protein
MHGMENVELYRITKHAKILILMAESLFTKIAGIHIPSNFLLLTLMTASCDLHQLPFPSLLHTMCTFFYTVYLM